MTLYSIPTQLTGFQRISNCTPSFSKSHQVFRNRDEIVIASMSSVFDETDFDVELFGILTLIADIFGLMSCILKDSH